MIKLHTQGEAAHEPENLRLAMMSKWGSCWFMLHSYHQIYKCWSLSEILLLSSGDYHMLMSIFCFCFHCYNHTGNFKHFFYLFHCKTILLPILAGLIHSFSLINLIYSLLVLFLITLNPFTRPANSS